MGDSGLPATARAVLIGAGIVGNSLVGHLARLGWSDVVLIDKGPLPNPGGSTGHASNFIYPVDHSREMTALTLDSMAQYEELGVRIECGGLEVARTEERMEELRRRMSSAASWGVDTASLVTPAEIKELVPYIDESVIVGGFYSPTVSVVDSLRAGTLLREQAQGSGALTVSANTEVLGIDVERGRVKRVRTTRGEVEADVVVICCGVWSPRLARMAGASIPLTPAVHQMIDIGPVPHFAGAKSAIEFPIVRDMDTNMYERQDGTGPAVNDLVGGHVDFLCEQSVSVTEQIKAGTIKGYVISAAERLASLPDIPSAKEAGIKYDMSIWAGIFAPKGVPKEVVDKLAAALDKALDDPAVQKRLGDLGASIPPKQERNPATFDRLVKAEIARWSPILKAASGAN